MGRSTSETSESSSTNGSDGPASGTDNGWPAVAGSSVSPSEEDDEEEEDDDDEDEESCRLRFAPMVRVMASPLLRP